MTLVSVLRAGWSNVGFVYLHALRTIDLQIVPINCPCLNLFGTHIRNRTAGAVWTCCSYLKPLFAHFSLLFCRSPFAVKPSRSPGKTTAGTTLRQLFLFCQVNLFSASIAPVNSFRCLGTGCKFLLCHDHNSSEILGPARLSLDHEVGLKKCLFSTTG